MIKTVTRKQLQAYGLSRYQTSVVTSKLAAYGQIGRSLTFPLDKVIEAIRDRLKVSRLKVSTRNTLASTLNHLLEQLGNIVEIPFVQSENQETQQAGSKLLQAISLTDAAFADLKAEAIEIYAKYKVAP